MVSKVNFWPQQIKHGRSLLAITFGYDPGFDAISSLDGEDFSISDEAFASSPYFNSLSSPSFLLPENFINTPPANSYASFAFSSSFLRVPNCVPRSLPRFSSEITMQSPVSFPNPVAEMQLGVNSFDDFQFPVDVLMLDEPGVRTIQPSNFDPSNNSSGIIEGEEKESDDDVTKFILEWLKRNEDVISLEDLRSICLKKSTIEWAERHLGLGPHGRMQLVQVILAWVQNHHLKKKKQRLLEPHQSDVIAWGNPLPLSNQGCSTNSGVVNSDPFHTGLQPIQYCSAPINPLYHQEENMASVSSAKREAQEKRMARKRRMASLRQSRALAQSCPTVQCVSVEQGKINSGNCAFWTTEAVNSHKGMELTDLDLLSGGSSSNSQTRQTIHAAWSGDSGTVRQQDLKFHDMNLKFVLQKVLKRSDVGSIGRIVIPKKEAEIHLPELDSKDGMIILMEDIRTSHVWEIRYRSAGEMLMK
ncbi:B3 domain-containing protein VP1-like protein [Carex littledalei]|uniref:B3 domain-containing protein VP1-like protein n=1 Tax=Carex littledalei TaxID=544730 RepID=A0A833VIB7_9POAL|nr:B3 domain-containing protein VP1-like protein [Carex littledalei]